MVQIFFDLADDAVLDVYYLVRLVRHTTLMRHHDNGHAVILVQLLQQKQRPS